MSYHLLISSLLLVAAQANEPALKIRVFQMITEDQQRESFQQVSPKELNVTFVDNESNLEVAAGTLQLAILCNASFPVAWDLGSFHEYNAMRSTMRNTHRMAPDPLDHTSFKYYATAVVYRIGNEMTGRLICLSTRNTSLSTSIYLYWKGNQDHIFVNFKQNITLPKSSVSNPQKVVLPCTVATPNATVVLYKFTVEGRTRLLRNESITYDPKVGFTLSNLPNVSGYYRCFTTQTNWDNDYVGIIVPSWNISTNSSTNATGTIVKSSPSISIDTKRQAIVCCSGVGGTKPPKMFNIICSHPTNCESAKRVSKVEHWFHFYQSRQTRTDDCTSFKLTPHYSSGVIRCSGQNFDVNLNYIFPLSELSRFYSTGIRSSAKIQINTVWTSWAEIIPEEMMVVGEAMSIHNRYMIPMESINQSMVVYHGEILNVACSTSPYYFSGGIKWALKFKNGTVVFQPGKNYMANDGLVDIQSLSMNAGNSNNLRVTADINLSSIICFAPVWNSSLWVHKAYHPYVNESKSAQVKLVSEEHVVWYLNETEQGFSCSATGSPLPTFTWSRDDDILENGTNTEITEHAPDDLSAVETVLKIHRVSHRTRGVYKCEAKNSAGSAFATVTVEVLEQSSGHHTVAITIGVISALGLLGAIGFFIWKIKEGRSSIRNLSNEITQGFANGEDSVDESIHNKIYDPTPLNADLLN